MLPPDVVQLLSEAWPPRRRGVLGTKPPSEVTPDLASALRRAAASGESFLFVLLSLAWEAEGPLRQRLLDEIAVKLAALPTRRWLRVDASARTPAWVAHRFARLLGGGASPGHPIVQAIHAGERRWQECASLAAVHAGLGRHVAPLLLASMHLNGRIRQAAAVELADDVRGLPALLVRVNDWVAPVRDSALTSLHRLVDPTHVGAWIPAIPLLVHLDACGRASHRPLIERVGALFRRDAARGRLLDAVRTADAPTARAVAEMVLRTHGTSDRDALAALLECPDMLVRLRVLDAPSAALDGDLLDVALRDPVATIRRRALDVLRERDADRFARRAHDACFDRSACVREYAVFHLRKVGAFDAAALADEAVARLEARRGDVLGALGLLCSLDDGEHVGTIREFADHPRGAVRLCAKRRLIRGLRADGPIDGRLVDDASPRIARRLFALLRARGVEPDLAQVVRRVEESPTDAEACAWLGTLAKGRLWDALPHVVRTLDDRRAPVAAEARRIVDLLTGRTFRSYVDPGGGRLGDLASAVRACRDARAAKVTAWVRAVTGRRDWPAGT